MAVSDVIRAGSGAEGCGHRGRRICDPEIDEATAAARPSLATLDSHGDVRSLVACRVGDILLIPVENPGSSLRSSPPSSSNRGRWRHFSCGSSSTLVGDDGSKLRMEEYQARGSRDLFFPCRIEEIRPVFYCCKAPRNWRDICGVNVLDGTGVRVKAFQDELVQCVPFS